MKRTCLSLQMLQQYVAGLPPSHTVNWKMSHTNRVLYPGRMIGMILRSCMITKRPGQNAVSHRKRQMIRTEDIVWVSLIPLSLLQLLLPRAKATWRPQNIDFSLLWKDLIGLTVRTEDSNSSCVGISITPRVWRPKFPICLRKSSTEEDLRLPQMIYPILYAMTLIGGNDLRCKSCKSMCVMSEADRPQTKGVAVHCLSQRSGAWL